MIGIGVGPSLGGLPPFTSPKLLSGLVAWYRADKGTTIATGVSAWADQSGVGDANRNLTQATGAKQPTLNASDATYNHQATLSFASAASQYLASGTFSVAIPNPSTQFVVGNWDGAASVEVMLDGIDGTNRQAIFNGGSGGSTVVAFFAGTQVNATVANNAVPLVMCALNNGASSGQYVNAKTPKSTTNPGANTAAGVTVGIDNDKASFPLNGKVAEVIVYNRALSQNEINRVLGYLGTRYGITIGS